MPGRKWYVVSLAVFLIGMAAFAAFLYSQLKDLGSGLQQVVVPGEAELVLDEPGGYTIFHEHESVVNGRYYSSPEEVPGLEVRVVSSATGEPVPLRAPGANTSYSLGGRSGVAIFAFDVDEPGRYLVAGDYAGSEEDGELVLAVGKGFGRKLVATILGSIAIGLASFVLAVAIAALTFWKRRQARRRAPGVPQSQIAR